jgi:V/A-type H+-transporting ATPase subunit I
MAVSQMLKIQILGHASVKEQVIAYLREAGVIEVTDASVEGFRGAPEEAHASNLSDAIEKSDFAIQFLGQYIRKPSLAERLSGGPMPVSPGDVEKTLREVDVERIAAQCGEYENTIKRCRDELSWSKDLVRELEPWSSLTSPFETLSTSRFTVQFWTFAEKTCETAFSRMYESFPLVEHGEVSRAGGRVHVAVIVLRDEGEALAELLKQAGGVRCNFERLTGTPTSIVKKEQEHGAALAGESERAENGARSLATIRPKLLVLSDHFREKKGLLEVESHVYHTERTFMLEGWMRVVDKRRIEKELSRRWSDVELVTRPPREGEDPPVHLDNKRAVQPFEFIMTLYGRPLYGEVDPTPLIAPFFILCFSICMSDAGYGLVLAALSAFLLYKLRIGGGMRLLMQVFLIGSILTVGVGILTGGYFGLDAKLLPPALSRLILINPLEEPMKMLNVAFLIGFIHILFGIGVRMVVNFRAHIWMDAIFDDLLWIVFLLALGPLGYAKVLGGTVPDVLLFYCGRISLAIAAVLLVTGARKEKNKFLGVIKSILKFYSITGYFSDVLSYARLLALGLASAAIAVAVNGIAQMVSGLPFYTGYIAAVVVLVLGHAFNLAVNILGAFVHSARLQYLEFFNKFFTGGGREFRPFRSERRYTVLKETGN